MFTIINASRNPRAFTDRHGRRVVVPNDGTPVELDLAKTEADWLAGLKEAGEQIDIKGSVSEGPAQQLFMAAPAGTDPDAPAPQPKPKSLAEQTLGKGGSMQSDLGARQPLGSAAGASTAVDELPSEEELQKMKRSELDDLAAKRGVDISGAENKADVIEALQNAAK